MSKHAATMTAAVLSVILLALMATPRIEADGGEYVLKAYMQEAYGHAKWEPLLIFSSRDACRDVLHSNISERYRWGASYVIATCEPRVSP